MNISLTGAYSEPCQASKIEFLCENSGQLFPQKASS